MRLFAFGNKQTEQKKTAHQLSKEASIEAHQVWICAHRKTIRIRHTRKKNVVEERHRKNEEISNKQPSTYIYLHILHYNIRPKWATKNYRRSLTRSLSSLGTPLTWVLVLSLPFPCSRLCVYFSLSLDLSIARSLHPTHRHNTVVAATRSHAVVSSSLDPVPYWACFLSSFVFWYIQ